MAGGIHGYHLQPFLPFFLFPACLLSWLLLRGRTAIFEKSLSATLDISTENSLVKEPSKSTKKVQLSQFKNRWAHRHPPSLPDAVLPIMMCTSPPTKLPDFGGKFWNWGTFWPLTTSPPTRVDHSFGMYDDSKNWSQIFMWAWKLGDSCIWYVRSATITAG